MPPSNLSRYATSELLLSWIEARPATSRYLVRRVQSLLDCYDFTLGDNDTPEGIDADVKALMEFFEQVADDLTDDLLDEDNEPLPSWLDHRCMHPVNLLEFVSAVWEQDFRNLKVREHYLDIEAHLEAREAAPKRKWETPGIPESRKKAKVDDTNVGYTPEKILDCLLATLQEHHSSRYGKLLDDPDVDVKKLVLENLARPFNSMFFDGVPATHQDLDALDSDMTQPGPAIYMHLIGHYRYVGQARDLRTRYRSHTSKAYHKKTPSLHYSVMDALPEAEDSWVVLAYVPILHVKREYRGLLLNIFEMMGALLFQTLTADALDVYLDPKIRRQDILVGLNIALPIHQQQDLVVDDDTGSPMHQLQNCKDALVAQFYNAAVKSAQEKRRETMLSKTHRDFLDGAERVIGNKSGGTGKIMVREVELNFTARVQKELGVSVGDTVNLRVEINAVGAHQSAWATDALNGDPATRLAIKCTTKAGITDYLHFGGERSVLRANALVDELEGVPLHESKKRERRSFQRSISGSREP